MPRPRKTADQLLASGTAVLNPGAYQGILNPPQPTAGIGNPPDHLTDLQKLCWHELVAQALPNTLGNSDRIALEMTSCLLAKFRQDPDNFGNPKLLRLETLIRCLGLTPADRSRVSERKQVEENPFAQVEKLRKGRRQTAEKSD